MVRVCQSPIGLISESFSNRCLSNPNFRLHTLVNDEEGIMKPGMAFTIEPILCQGSAVGIQWPDKWTITTADGGRSAQFEHTVRFWPNCSG